MRELGELCCCWPNEGRAGGENVSGLCERRHMEKHGNATPASSSAVLYHLACMTASCFLVYCGFSPKTFACNLMHSSPCFSLSDCTYCFFCPRAWILLSVLFHCLSFAHCVLTNLQHNPWVIWHKPQVLRSFLQVLELGAGENVRTAWLQKG